MVHGGAAGPFDPLGLAPEAAGTAAPPAPAAVAGLAAAAVLQAAGPATAGSLDPQTAVAIRSVMGPLTTVLEMLFLARIIMSWFPKAMREPTKLPWGAVYIPTELVCRPTRALVDTLNGVDVTPVIWFCLLSLSNEVLWSRQGLLTVLAK
eukprot:EG_transcript_32099